MKSIQCTISTATHSTLQNHNSMMLPACPSDRLHEPEKTRGAQFFRQNIEHYYLSLSYLSTPLNSIPFHPSPSPTPSLNERHSRRKDRVIWYHKKKNSATKWQTSKLYIPHPFTSSIPDILLELGSRLDRSMAEPSRSKAAHQQQRRKASQR